MTPVSSLLRGFSATTFVDSSQPWGGQPNVDPRECQTDWYRLADTMGTDVVDQRLGLVHFRAMDKSWCTVTKHNIIMCQIYQKAVSQSSSDYCWVHC